ncbi:hypothetical protein WMF11_24955 [Sorangium sp. So ce295]|uniref:hypothetical protein n=1 Tax=Sorangium sp. So ce295 TaxID=3133295 RepID=UPI003F615FA0
MRMMVAFPIAGQVMLAVVCAWPEMGMLHPMMVETAVLSQMMALVVVVYAAQKLTTIPCFCDVVLLRSGAAQGVGCGLICGGADTEQSQHESDGHGGSS